MMKLCVTCRSRVGRFCSVHLARVQFPSCRFHVEKSGLDTLENRLVAQGYSVDDLERSNPFTRWMREG